MADVGGFPVGASRRYMLLGALAAGLSLPAAFAASNVRADDKKLVVGFTIWDLTIPFAVPFSAALKETAEKRSRRRERQGVMKRVFGCWPRRSLLDQDDRSGSVLRPQFALDDHRIRRNLIVKENRNL